MNPEPTMGYTKFISQDDRNGSAKLGQLFAQICLKNRNGPRGVVV
jgi:hypothetical protein